MNIKNKYRRNLGVALVAALGYGGLYSCQDASELEYAKYMSNGKDLYVSRCQNCHGGKGEGLAQLAPPLTDTASMKANKANLACMIKNGSPGGLTIHGKTYTEKMPAFPDLAPIDIAQVMVYVTNSFGNKQGMYTYDEVIKALEDCNK